jgi:hypothetical protein
MNTDFQNSKNRAIENRRVCSDKNMEGYGHATRDPLAELLWDDGRLNEAIELAVPSETPHRDNAT